MEYVSIREFFLKNSTPDSCNYCAFVRKMKKLRLEKGEESGIKKINSSLSIVDLNKSELYKNLLIKDSRKLKKLGL